MFNILTILALLFALSKKDEIIVNNTKNAESEVQVFVEDYKKLMNGIVDEKIIDNVKITMADLDTTKAGVCWPENKPVTIQIDRVTWELYDENRREILVFHELGHCVCDLEHVHFLGQYSREQKPPEKEEDRLRSGFLEDGCPVSIMHPFVLSSQCYSKHRQHYRYELHLRCHSKMIQKNST